MLTHNESKYSCECGKSFYRLDLLRKHQKSCNRQEKTKEKTKEKSFNCIQCGKTFGRNFCLKRHQAVCNNTPALVNSLLERTEKHLAKLERGKLIQSILVARPDIYEDVLDTDERQCLDLFQSTENGLDMESVVFKPWQKQVFEWIDHPCDRVVYWVIGSQGAEGKTFLQRHIAQQFGSRRVFKGELNAKNSDIGYVMSKQPLTCKDIFLFNMRRSDTESAYGVLESLKDGYFLSNKYHTKILKIKSPNIVIVFSNSHPTTSQLSNDRWKIYEIIGDELRTRLKLM